MLTVGTVWKVKNPRNTRQSGDIFGIINTVLNFKETEMAKDIEPVRTIEEKNKAIKEQQNDLAKEIADKKIPIITAARKNNLGKPIWYITLSIGRPLATKSKAHYEAALKLLATKTPVTFKVDKEDYLTEIKAA